MGNNAKRCLHCSTEFSSESDFCCRGCESAYKIIQDFGLKKFYDYRKSETSNLETANINSEIIDFTQFAKKIPDNSFEIELSVKGIKCGSCVWLIEKALEKQPSVKNSRVNFTTAKLYINWQGDISEINNLCGIVAQMGYGITPYDHKKIYDEIEFEKNSLLKKLIVSGFAIVAVMMFSDGLWEDSRKNIGSATHDFLHWILILIGFPAIIYSGSYFFSSAVKSLKSKALNMDVPIASSILVILLLSFYQAIIGDENFYLDSAIMLIFSLLTGRYLELQARYKAKASALEMVDLLTGFATKINDDGTKKIISSKDLKEGDIVIISVGEKIPSDGIITEGNSEFDTSLITGETLPKTLKIGQAVYAGMINLATPIKIIITKEIANSQVAKILNLLENAEKSKTGYSLLAEKATKLYIPLVYGSALFTIILWYFFLGASFEKSIIYAASVLIITCPCALGLAIPVVNVLAFGKLFKNSLMLKNGEIIEKIPLCDKIIFDKTGTLTEGNFKISNLSDFTEEELKIATSLAIKSSHMLSKAI
ncbi:MAG: heavy metal translocating P-type ATPase metal-binding domain-containing protein, partial [Rickettsiales bacterium]|nr:heavy metal translocating P-type ATPase metal-binding domain-containing protein [Rickettsiales bacterium]